MEEAAPVPQSATVFPILGAISLAHLLNDMMQSIIVATYPLFKTSLDLNFTQIGLITLTYQLTASMLQPFVGLVTDRRPMPYSLPIGMGFTLAGIILLAVAPSYGVLLAASALIGSGSSVFHPESSRVARMASGGRPGLAQSLFQVGGNAGQAFGPLLAALVIVPRGQGAAAWFALAAFAAIAVLLKVGGWYRDNRSLIGPRPAPRTTESAHPRRRIALVITVLATLVFSKALYTTSLSSFYVFYLMQRFGLSVTAAQIYLFVFLGAVAAGAVAGGPIGDRIGRKPVIWGSILGSAPFTLALPFADLFWTGILSVLIGLILSSAFSAIIVYAQELVPGRVGLVSGLFFGWSFGMGGIGAAVLGRLADTAGIEAVYRICAYLPLIGLLAILLPDLKEDRA